MAAGIFIIVLHVRLELVYGCLKEQTTGQTTRVMATKNLLLKVCMDIIEILDKWLQCDKSVALRKRVELCDRLMDTGGITPTDDLIRQVIQSVRDSGTDCPIMVMTRLVGPDQHSDMRDFTLDSHVEDCFLCCSSLPLDFFYCWRQIVCEDQRVKNGRRRRRRQWRIAVWSFLTFFLVLFTFVDVLFISLRSLP